MKTILKLTKNACDALHKRFDAAQFLLLAVFVVCVAYLFYFKVPLLFIKN
jgi:hypothetical protein